MNTSKKIFLWGSGAASVCIVMLALFFLIARHGANLEFVKTEVVHSFSEKTGGQLAYERAKISFFPRARIVFHSVNFSIPEKISGTVTSLTLYPRLLPLLKGSVQLAEIKALAPDLIVVKPEPPAENPDKKSSPAKSGGLGIAELGLTVPDCGVDIKQGHLVFSKNNQPVFSFREIRARITGTEKKSIIRLDCQSNLWGSLSFDADVNRKNFQIKGQIAIHELHPHKITDHLFPQTPRKLSDSQVDLDLDIQGVWPDAIHGRITGGIPSLTLQRGTIQTVIKARALEGAFRIDRDIIEVTLDNIDLDHPHLSLSGKFQKNKNSSQISLDLEGRDIDVAAARKTALAAGGDIPVIGHIFDIVKSGHVPAITFAAHGNHFADLGRLENFILKGHLVDGGIFIPGLRRSVDQVIGDVVIADGILEGKNLAARLENSTGKNGRLNIGLSGKNAPFHLDITVDADLAQLPPVLKQVVGHEQFLKELHRIDHLKGSATGQLVLGESLDAITAHVMIAGFNLSGAYSRIPFPLEIKGGHFSYDARGITADHLTGKIGNSAFSTLSGHIDFDDTPFIDVSKGEITLNLAEFFPWISTFDAAQIAKYIQTAAGGLEISQIRLKGPLFAPVTWDIDAVGSFQNLVLDSNFSPNTITLKNGHFHAISQADAKTFSFSDTRLAFLDGTLAGSGLITLNAGGRHKIEALFKGDIGPLSNNWISTRLDIPSELAWRSPLSVSSAYLSWEKKTRTLFMGDLKFPQGPDLHLDIVQTPDTFRVNEMTVKDENARASASLYIKDKTLDFNFKGRIDQMTSDRIFVEGNLPDGWVDGDLSAHIRLDQPMASTVQGNLKGGNLKLPRIMGFPLDISAIALTADQHRVRLTSAVVTLDENNLNLKGDALFSKEGLLLDMDIAADQLNVDHIRNMLKKTGYTQHANIRDSSDSGPVTRDGVFDYPVTGSLRLTSASLVYGQTTWQPFQAEIQLDRDNIHVNVTHAKIHGISTPGQVVIKRTTGDLALEFKPEAKNQPLAPVIDWLFNGEKEATGLFELSGVIKALGPPEMMPASLTGDFELIASNGSIFKATTLSNILTFLNSTEILFGKNPGIGKEGFAYKTITLKAALDNGRLTLKEAVMDGASMELIGQGYVDLIGKKLNLTVLVAPLKTVDRVIKMTPLVGYILAGSLVSIPLEVTGDYAQPKISILPVAAVGRGLMGILERTFKLPLKIIEPMLSKEKATDPAKPEPIILNSEN